MKIEIVGDLCVASGENWSYERVGDLSVFTQTGKIPSLRIIKSILKAHLKMHDIGAVLVSGDELVRDAYGNPPFISGSVNRCVDRAKGGPIKTGIPYIVGEAK